MVEKLVARRGPRQWIDIGIGVVLARVEQLAHAPGFADRGVAAFGGADGLDELRGQQGIALDAFGDHEARRDIPQAQRHRGDDEKAGEGKPAQQIELPTPALALARDCLLRYCCRFQRLHERRS